MTQPFVDRFEEARRPGRVVGQPGANGVLRKGADVEGVVGIDHGALRIQPLIRPGWGRSGVAYGPYQRDNGLAFAVCVLNGHNTSEAGDVVEGIRQRLQRWVRGSGTDPVGKRLLGWLRNGHRQPLLWKVRHWLALQRTYKNGHGPAVDENLAVGWFPGEAPADASIEGNTFVMHAAGPENGELWARVGAHSLPAVRGVQNVPIYYVVALRVQGAAYYAASLPNAHGLGPYPQLRPLAIDPFQDETQVYAGLWQSVQGQIGFRVDTRVYGAQVAPVPAWTAWYGSAHAADGLQGNGPVAGTAAECGGDWIALDGTLARSPAGAGGNGSAMLDPGAPSGLVHAVVETAEATTSGCLCWRVQDAANCWQLHLSGSGCRLTVQMDGHCTAVGDDAAQRLRLDAPNSVQILDDGTTFALYLNGALLFDTRFDDGRLGEATGVGVAATEGLWLQALEAHPRLVPLPDAFDLPAPWQPTGDRLAIMDDFDGPAGELSGRTTASGGKVWRKGVGSGAIALTGDGGARVLGSVEKPNPGRLIYTVAWDDPTFADVEATITPPGSTRGQWERGRGGLVFWQDPDNYIIVNTWLDDHYEGASISSFFYLNGFEDLYDAVWTNVGGRVYWGVPYRLRVVFDGTRYAVFVDDEPVLVRALTDVYPDARALTIQKVGIVANWEWGDDTGSIFRRFAAKAKA